MVRKSFIEFSFFVVVNITLFQILAIMKIILV